MRRASMICASISGAVEVEAADRIRFAVEEDVEEIVGVGEVRVPVAAEEQSRVPA